MSSLTRDPAGAFDELGLEAPFAESFDAGEAFAPPWSGEFGETPFAEAFQEHFDVESELTVERQVASDGETFPSGLVLKRTSGATGEGEEHWDPSATGLPLLATGPSVQPERLSSSFTVKELVTSGGRAADVARISPALVRVLQSIRERADKAVRITSGYRSWARNQQVYAGRKQEPTKSRHCSGQAADIKIAGKTGMEIAKLAIDAAGTDLAIGIGADYIHVDVRGKWTVWTYFKGAADKAALAEIGRYREQARRGDAPGQPAPAAPVPPEAAPKATRPSGVRRLVIAKHPMLRGHRGTAPDLILRWNSAVRSGEIDVVVHFHGHSGRLDAMRLDVDKEPISGLDFADPLVPGSPGRTRPTLAILPRGNYAPTEKRPKVYNFRDLVGKGALDKLIQDALARLGQATGHQLRRGRLVLTAHSGGGAAVERILAHADPDEVHILDGMYGPGTNILRWAERRIARDLAAQAPLPPALRIVYNPRAGTELHSLPVARVLCRVLAAAASARLRPLFRVDRTSVDHNDIPRHFGWRLLANPAADLPGATTIPCPDGSAGEEPEASQSWESAPNDREESEQEAISMDEQGFDEADEALGADQVAERWDGEALAWLDVEAEAEWLESPIAEQEWLETEDSETGWSGAGSGEGPDGEEFEEFEQFGWSEDAGEAESGAWETSYEDEAAAYEWGETEEGEEAGEIERFGELEDERDAEWESAELEDEMEEEAGLAGSGLTPAEQKAVAITSTLETGKRGGFYGLSGNFDGQGLSFGLVNWTIGTGSLQPLLRDFAAEQPARWALAFGPDATRFLQLISPTGEAARKEQHRFAVEEMNGSSIVKGKRKWAIREPWVTYFKRLSEDSAFQQIQIRYVRDLLARADYFCHYFALKSEQAFAFMFDAVSSHGKWWLTKKFAGQEKRRILVEQRLKALTDRHGAGKIPESEILLAIADVLGATSAPRWAAMVRARKRWFVTGEHSRAGELRGLEPRPNLPYSTLAGTPVSPAPGAPSQTPSAPDLGAEIARIAEQELRRWHPPSGTLRETDAAAVPILQRYYGAVPGAVPTAAELQSAAWHNSNYWSAVFVSWVMAQAGAGTRFNYSRAHRVYIRTARLNRLNGVSASPFWAYRATEVAPQIGDLICNSRSNPGVTYDTIADTSQDWPTHCDIVTEVRADGLRVIGGNVDASVRARPRLIRTLPDGRLALDGNQAVYFAVVRCRGAAPALGAAPPVPNPPPPTPTPAPAPPAARASGKRLTPAQLVAAFGASARASQAKNGVPALVTLGQAALESGWGERAPRFNFFGIKAKGSDPEPTRQLLRTREVFADRNRKFPAIISITPRADGKFDYVVKDWFRAFPDAATAFNAHGEFLVRNKRYAKAFAVAGDPYAFAAQVARAGYATDPSYESTLTKVMRMIEAAGGP